MCLSISPGKLSLVMREAADLLEKVSSEEFRRKDDMYDTQEYEKLCSLLEVIHMQLLGVIGPDFRVNESALGHSLFVYDPDEFPLDYAVDETGAVLVDEVRKHYLRLGQVQFQK